LHRFPQLIEERKEYNVPTFLAFADYERAPKRVNRNELRNIMAERDFLQHLGRTVQNPFHETQKTVQTEGEDDGEKETVL
jgi:hypothetical protein